MKYIKRNKLLSFYIFITVLVFILGILYHSILPNELKEIVKDNTNNIIKNKINLNEIKNIILNNSIYSIIIWILGISIIGSIIVLILFEFKVFIYSFELTSLIINLKLNNILFIIIYLIPKTINIIIYFIITYYSINYSIYLFKYLILKKNYNIKSITNKYIKVLIKSQIILLISLILEIFIVPKLNIIIF